MATEESDGSRIQRTSGRRFAALKGRLFEWLLLAATLFGLVALAVLFGYLTFDAFEPMTASVEWYLLYLGAIVPPTALFTLYARRRPAVRRANAKVFGAIFGGTVASLLVYVLVTALSPYDVLIFLWFGCGPPIIVWIWGTRRDLGAVAGPVTPVAGVVGIAIAFGLYGILRPIVGVFSEWVAFFAVTTVPVVLLTLAVVPRRWSKARISTLGRTIGVITAAVLFVGSFVAAAQAHRLGIDPSFSVTLWSLFLAPAGYVLFDTLVTERGGRSGVLGPFVMLGGVALAVTVERTTDLAGPESYVSPSLVLNSWHNLDPTQAGVYPQLAGSIVVVTFMSMMAFPVGLGAAIYLEEYAPSSDLRGQLASLLEVNISNLAGVPSVVYGILGLALFRRTLGFGTGVVISAAGTLGLLILPIVVVSAQEALRSVPDSLREASYGMGASKWQTLRNVVLPRAVPGVLTGTILALARAIGETAPLVIIAVATTTYSAPEGLFSSATALPLQIFAARSHVDPAYRHGIVPATAILLLGLMLTMNAAAILVRNRYDDSQ